MTSVCLVCGAQIGLRTVVSDRCPRQSRSLSTFIITFALDRIPVYLSSSASVFVAVNQPISQPIQSAFWVSIDVAGRLLLIA